MDNSPVLLRYCIACGQVFGCVREGKKTECLHCDEASCMRPLQCSCSDTTGGVCAECWEKRASA